MRTARATGLALMLVGLAIRPMALVAASVPNFPRNPEGERLYVSHESLLTLLPVATIVVALVAAWIAQRIARKVRKPGYP